jgi:hypothetical protein
VGDAIQSVAEISISPLFRWALIILLYFSGVNTGLTKGLNMNSYSYEQIFKCGATIEEGTRRALLWFSFHAGESDTARNNGKSVSVRHECHEAFSGSQTRSEHDISQFEEVGALQTCLFQKEWKVNNLQFEQRNCGSHLQRS